MKNTPKHHSARLLLLVALLLGIGYSATVQAQTPPEPDASPGFWQRFRAIFDAPPPAEVNLLMDSLGSTAQEHAGSLTERYAGVYNLIHREQQTYYQSLATAEFTRWDEINGISEADYSALDDTIFLRPEVRVVGYHPHWMGQAYQDYPFGLLTHVNLFSYNINVDGYQTPYDNASVVESFSAPDYELIGLAQSEGCKVMLTVTSFGRRENRLFLSDRQRQEAVAADLAARVVKSGLDGIDLDFELIPDGYERRFSEFVRLLHGRLAFAGADFELSVVLPKVNRSNVGNAIYEIDTLERYVDFFTLTAYDFTTGDYAPGPIAPLYNKDRRRGQYGSIEDIVFTYLEAGLDRDKLVLGLPHYGGRWTTYEARYGADSSAFEHLTYTNVRRITAGEGPPNYVPDAYGAERIRVVEPLTGRFSRVTDAMYYDDAYTLGVKQDWAVEQGLGGIGIWALGYDHPYPELWEGIGESFSLRRDTIVRYDPPLTLFGLPGEIVHFRQPLAICGLFLLLFLGAGLLLALFDWRVREAFFRNKALQFYYVAGLFSAFTATLIVLLFLRPGTAAYFGPGVLTVTVLALGALACVVIIHRLTAWLRRIERP